MFTLTQISAVLGLLLAFGVPQATVTNIQGILEATSTPQTVQATSTTPIVINLSTSTPESSPILSTPVPVKPISMLTFSGWDGSKVVATNSVTVTVSNSDGSPAVNVPIEIDQTFDDRSPIPRIVSTTDSNGEYVFNVVRDAGSGNMDFTIKVPSLNLSQSVNMHISTQ